jgi:tRNA (guanine37-N1)-methyltransferase
MAYQKRIMTFHIITLFPEAMEKYLDASILGRAGKKKILKFDLVNLRDFGLGRHKQVDDRPFGGGPGMVLKIEPIAAALASISNSKSKILNPKQILKSKAKKSKTRIVLFSTRGKRFTQKEAKRLSKYDDLIFICGRYEGVDERVAKYLADEEISIGNFVLAGGELPALIVAEAVGRQVPGVLGKAESLEDVKGSYPVYTRPPVWKRHKVPEALISGNHKEINKWRRTGRF